MTRILGPDHPHTTLAAWNLFNSLIKLEEYEDAQQILTERLLWLLDDNVILYDADQQQIRKMLKQILKQ
jgi:hypothetical protein